MLLCFGCPAKLIRSLGTERDDLLGSCILVGLNGQWNMILIYNCCASFGFFISFGITWYLMVSKEETTVFMVSYSILVNSLVRFRYLNANDLIHTGKQSVN